MASSIDYSRVPAASPPPGLTANFINPPTLACSVLEVSVPLSVTATAFVAARIYIRACVARKLRVDDLFLVLALVFSWVFCALGIIEGQYGYGVDIWNLYLSDAINFLKLDLVSQVIYHLGLLSIKISILFFYLPLTSSLIIRRSTFTLIAFTTTYSLSLILVAIFGCSPISGAWDMSGNAKCVDKASYYYVQATCNIVSSWAMLGLGTTVAFEQGLLGRNVVRGMRVCLGVFMMVGCFACGVSIVRLVIMAPYLHGENFTHFKVFFARWCEIELSTLLILASTLSLHSLLSKYFPSLLSPPPSFSPCQSRKMSASTTAASQTASVPMSRVSSRRDVSLEDSQIGSTTIIENGSERRILGAGKEGVSGILEKKGGGAVVKTVMYDVKYEA